MNLRVDRQSNSHFEQIDVVGTPVSLVSLERLLSAFENWLRSSQDRYVVFRDVHGVIAARSNHQLDQSHKNADIVAPDGMPIVWTMRAAGAAISRLCGPDVLPAVCSHGLRRGWRHYFYGGRPDVTAKLIDQLATNFQDVNIVGSECPPFRTL